MDFKYQNQDDVLFSNQDKVLYGNQQQDDVLDGVGCTVTNCQYNNKEDMCTADGILVNTQRNSVSETDTFCDTFVAEEQDI